MKEIKLLALVLAGSLAACGGGTTEENTGNPDAGTQSGTDAGEQVATNGLTINVPLGITLTDVPTSDGHAVAGSIEVKRNGVTITTATVTINGYALTGYAETEMYPIADDDGAIPDAAPGKVLKIVAKDGSDTAELNLPCPTEVTFTSPADGTEVSAGQTVNFTWSGKVGPYAISEYMAEPTLRLNPNDPREDGDHPGFITPAQGQTQLTLEPSATSGSLTLPEIDQPAYLVRLYVPGDEVKSGEDDFGYCQLVRTLHLTKAAQ